MQLVTGLLGLLIVLGASPFTFAQAQGGPTVPGIWSVQPVE